MGLFQKAIETFESMEHIVGVEKEGAETLAPISHMIANASINITINIDGDFVSAKAVNQKIPIPVDEDSAGRTNGLAAHYLCEQVEYICAENQEKHKLYLARLQEWVASEYTHPKVEAILRYVEKETVAEDLYVADLLKRNKNGEIQNKNNIIAWSVIGRKKGDSNVWRDQTLQQLFSQYYLSKVSGREPQFCMVTGVEVLPAKKHPRGVDPLHGSAKFISSNDKENFTYRGRFWDDSEALTVGYEASQKAHSAIKWLIATRGVVLGGRTFLCWNPKGKNVPDVTASFCAGLETKPADIDNYREILRKALLSYRQGLPDDEDVIFAVFDATTRQSGREAILYYSEFYASDFLHRLHHWDETCVWYDAFGGVQSPALKRIAVCAFGTQRGEKGIELDDRVLRQQIARLLLCRVEKQPFPTDIMRALVQKASNLQVYTKNNRRILLATTCAVVKKYRFDRFKEEWNLALERDKKDRSYQYGRLLAVLEKIEQDVLDKMEEKRDTNALRMQSVFVQRPAYATKIIMDQLKTAYYPRMSKGKKVFYEQVIGEIMEKISEFPEADYNAPLRETYLLGYYLQRNEFYRKKENTELTEENENE